MKKIILILISLIVVSCVPELVERDNPLDPEGEAYVDLTGDGDGNNGGTGDTTYTLTYIGNGASGTPVADTGLTNNQTEILSDGNSMTKLGYIFNGWTNSEGTLFDGGDSLSITKNVILYAKWVVPFASISLRNMASVTGGVYHQSNYNDTNAWGSNFIHTISDFKIAQNEVSYQLWYEVRSWAVSKGYVFASLGRAGHDGNFGEIGTDSMVDRFEPVTYINWRDAVVWCNAYSQLAGLTPCYKVSGKIASNSTESAVDGVVCDWVADGYRLPTEGEWQYAAAYIDGTSWTPINYLAGATANFSNLTESAKVAHYNLGETISVGAVKTPTSLYLYNMSGNVFEWCWDRADIYPVGPETDYRGSSDTSKNRVLRGGGYNYTAAYCTISIRGAGNEDTVANDTGFRVAQTQ